jgi:hypothetical protein
MPMPSATRQPRFPRQSSPAGPDQLRSGKDERADVTTDGQVSLFNGTVHVSGPSADRRSLAQILQRGVDHGIERCYALGGGPTVRNGPVVSGES